VREGDRCNGTVWGRRAEQGTTFLGRAWVDRDVQMRCRGSMKMKEDNESKILVCGLCGAIGMEVKDGVS